MLLFAILLKNVFLSCSRYSSVITVVRVLGTCVVLQYDRARSPLTSLDKYEWKPAGKHTVEEPPRERIMANGRP